MRNKQWLRLSLASLTLIGGGLGAFLVACGDDDDNSVVAKPDSGADTGDGDEDGGDQPDSGQPKPGVDAGTPARLQMVNAATDLGPNDESGLIRVCFGAGTAAENVQVTGLPALPDKGNPPGVPIGIGGPVEGTGLDLTSLFIQPYLMNAESLAKAGIVNPGGGKPGAPCSDILKDTFDAGAGPLVENVDYWKLPVIPAGSLLKDKSYLLVLSGCTSDTAIADTTKCGAGFTAGTGPGVGNLTITIHELDNETAVATDKIGTQFIHASAPLDVKLATIPGEPKTTPGYISGTPADPTTFKGLSADGGAEPVEYNKQTALIQVAGVNVAADAFTINPNIPDFAIPLAMIQGFSYPSTAYPQGTPDYAKYRNGASFTFITVGDPDEPQVVDSKPNPKTFHYLGFPNNPPVAVYNP